MGQVTGGQGHDDEQSFRYCQLIGLAYSLGRRSAKLFSGFRLASMTTGRALCNLPNRTDSCQATKACCQARRRVGWVSGRGEGCCSRAEIAVCAGMLFETTAAANRKWPPPPRP